MLGWDVDAASPTFNCGAAASAQASLSPQVAPVARQVSFHVPRSPWHSRTFLCIASSLEPRRCNSRLAQSASLRYSR
jgi:hypothetical protein